MHRTKRTKAARSLAKAAELAVAVPQVISIRTARAVAAGANPSAADRGEFMRMGTEKVQAYWECLFAISAQLARINQEYARTVTNQWLRLCMTPWWLAASWPQAFASLVHAASAGPWPSAKQQQNAVSALTQAGLLPLHKRATANVRRLAKTKNTSSRR